MIETLVPVSTSSESLSDAPESVLYRALLNDVYDANTIREPWQAGDVLLVDNVRTAHSRDPVEGQREVLVAMADPVRLP